jgi:putative transposase
MALAWADQRLTEYDVAPSFVSGLNWSLALKEGPDDEAPKAFGRADHRDLEGARGQAEDLYRKHGISEASFYNWKAKYGGLEVSEAKRLKGLESENAKLKKLLADAMLDNAALKDLLGKKMVTPVGSIHGQGNIPFASRMSCSAIVRSARCSPVRNTQGVWPTRSAMTVPSARRSIP